MVFSIKHMFQTSLTVIRLRKTDDKVKQKSITDENKNRNLLKKNLQRQTLSLLLKFRRIDGLLFQESSPQAEILQYKNITSKFKELWLPTSGIFACVICIKRHYHK